MPLQINHAFVSAVADGADTTLIRPSNWNAALSHTMATAKILGRTTTAVGAVEELGLTNGLGMASTSLYLNPSAIWLGGVQGGATTGVLNAANLTTTLTQITTTVATGKTQKLKIRVANQLASAGGATCDIAVTNGTVTYYLVKNLRVDLGTAQDIIEDLYLPATWRVSARASIAGALTIVATGLETTAPTTPIGSGLLFGSNLSTTLGTIGSAVATGRMQKHKLRASNVHATSAASLDLAINNGTNTFYLVQSLIIAAGTAQDVIEDLVLPATWRIQARASAATSLDLVVTGQEIAA